MIPFKEKYKKYKIILYNNNVSFYKNFFLISFHQTFLGHKYKIYEISLYLQDEYRSYVYNEKRLYSLNNSIEFYIQSIFIMYTQLFLYTESLALI